MATLRAVHTAAGRLDTMWDEDAGHPRRRSGQSIFGLVPPRQLFSEDQLHAMLGMLRGHWKHMTGESIPVTPVEEACGKVACWFGSTL